MEIKILTIEYLIYKEEFSKLLSISKDLDMQVKVYKTLSRFKNSSVAFAVVNGSDKIFVAKNKRVSYKNAVCNLLHEIGHILDSRRSISKLRWDVLSETSGFSPKQLKDLNWNYKKTMLYSEFIADKIGFNIIDKFGLNVDKRFFAKQMLFNIVVNLYEMTYGKDLFEVDAKHIKNKIDKISYFKFLFNDVLCLAKSLI